MIIGGSIYFNLFGYNQVNTSASKSIQLGGRVFNVEYCSDT